MSFRTILFGLPVLKRSLNVRRKPTPPKLSFRDFSDQKGFKISTKNKLMTILSKTHDDNSDKVTVVGNGDVGMACIFSILTQGISSDVAMIDLNENKMMGELYDLQHGCLFLNAKISAGKGNDYSVTAGSKVCVIAAGLRGFRRIKGGKSLQDLVQRNTDVLKTIVPNLVKYSPNTIIIVVTNPSDILAYVAWKLSGLPKNRVFGTGTNLESARFRVYIAQKMGVAPKNVHALIIGEHGDSSVPVWSSTNISGVRLKDLNPNIGTQKDPETWGNIHKDVIQSPYEIIKLKGFTNWAIGLSVANLCGSILRNSKVVHPVSTDIKGMCGIEDEIFLSLPCTLGHNGIISIIDPHLSEDEIDDLKLTAAKLAKIINQIKF